jgi:hypothetical protein
VLFCAHGAEVPLGLLINAVLTASSAALFCYWFRYTCLLILAAETAHDYSGEVAEANQLSFPEVRSSLRRRDADLERLHKCLERDFAIITYLLEHTPSTGSVARFEDVLLKIQYRALTAWFHLTRCFLRGTASQALKEMSRVVAHFANAMGERSPAFGSIGGGK